MNYDLLRDRLSRVVNLKEFADRAKMHRRTLQRVINREGSPNLATLEAIEQKLKEIKPKMRPKPPPATDEHSEQTEPQAA